MYGDGDPLVGPDVVFKELDGVVAVEAEHFFKQTHTDVRKWYIVTEDDEPKVAPDGDPSHAKSASNGIYMEALPDTRRSHDDKLIRGENFINEPGKFVIDESGEVKKVD